MTNFNIILLVFAVCLSFTACREDNSLFVSDDITSRDDTTIMKIKKIQSTTEAEEYTEAEWNADSTVKMIKMNLAFSENRTANYVYENGRITETILKDNHDDSNTDTIVYHYNTEGQVDSMYLKVDTADYNSSISLAYTAGKLTRLTGYTDTAISYYWDIETDNHHNVIKAIEYLKEDAAFVKENSYTYTRDDKMNPFKDLAVYMLYLDDAYNIFQIWGNNNYTEQRYIGHTGTPVDMTTGSKYKYNDHGYPESYMNTIMGTIILNEDAFRYTYY